MIAAPMPDDSGEWLAHRRDLFLCTHLQARLTLRECARRQLPLAERAHTWGHAGAAKKRLLVPGEHCLSGKCEQGKENLVTLQKKG